MYTAIFAWLRCAECIAIMRCDSDSATGWLVLRSLYLT